MRIKEGIYTFLAAALAVAILLFAVIFTLSSCNKPSIPAQNTPQNKEYIEIQDFTGYKLSEAIDFLSELGIEYEIVPVSDGERGKVISIEFEGYKDNGLLFVEKGTKLMIFGNDKAGKDKVVYLTFDDGPTLSNTIEIVDILEQYNAKATFFVLGNRIHEYDDRIEYIYEKGHEIGCHSYSHDMNRESEGYIYASVDVFLSEIDRFEKALKDVLGEEKYNGMPKLFRFPGGSYSNGRLEDSEVPAYIKAVHDKGYLIYDWTILTNDAATDDMKEDETYEEFYLRSLTKSLEKAEENDLPLVLLMHDQRRTRENLCAILDYLVDNGYTFELLSNCPEYVFSK